MGGREQSVQPDAAVSAVSLRRCGLTLLSGPERGREHRLNGDVIRVGKAPENDLVLADETVSRFHFEIVRDLRGYLLRDLRSTNGTHLDGSEIREAYLRSGSVIRAGAVEIRFVPSEERLEISPSQAHSFGDMVGLSEEMRSVFGVLERVAPTDTALLIEGERGTGKSLAARAVHERSARGSGPFVVVDCGAIAGTLIESELFGHERGAFTGAGAARPGAFERARGGTLVLDQVGELALDLQPKLLRVLERREAIRLGGSAPIRTDVRIIALTARDLRGEVEKGKFLGDLFLRLDSVSVYIPPLRDRRVDIPTLVSRFVEEFGDVPADFPLDDEHGLSVHDWPGNVAELRAVIGRMCSGASPLPMLRDSGQPMAAGTWPGVRSGDGLDFEPEKSFREHKESWNEQFERRYLVWLLRRSDGNISKAARDADMDRKYLHKLIKKYEIDPAML